MAVLVPGKMLFLCNPRTASVATARTLMDLPGAVKAGPHHVPREHVEGYAGEPTVATVRNPYDALVSWWFHVYGWPSFADFIAGYDHHPFLEGNPRDLFWQCAPDTHILRYETLQADLDAFLEGVGLPPVQLVRKNVTKRKTLPWREYYDEAAIRAANKRFGKMVDRWGYERLVVPGTS